ncbi:hypothetical protein PFISCL1PPCAC_25960, partial [Pristionchus fissidentatus]
QCDLSNIMSKIYERNRPRIDHCAALEKPYANVHDDRLLRDLTWSDPTISLKGITFNTDRRNSMKFGEDAFIHGMENIGCEFMIRDHQV